MHWGSIKLVQAAQTVLERERSGTGEGLVGLETGWACIGDQLNSFNQLKMLLKKSAVGLEEMVL